jgi:hypothetical protein
VGVSAKSRGKPPHSKVPASEAAKKQQLRSEMRKKKARRRQEKASPLKG